MSKKYFGMDVAKGDSKVFIKNINGEYKEVNETMRDCDSAPDSVYIDSDSEYLQRNTNFHEGLMAAADYDAINDTLNEVNANFNLEYQWIFDIYKEINAYYGCEAISWGGVSMSQYEDGNIHFNINNIISSDVDENEVKNMFIEKMKEKGYLP